MKAINLNTGSRSFFAIAFLLLISAVVPAQTGETIAEVKQRAVGLINQQKYTEALPLFEKLVIAEPANPEHQYHLAFSLLAQATTTKDASSRKALRIRSRNAFVKSKELGIKEPNVDALIQSIPPDGADGRAFSTNTAANDLMLEAESFFSQGKLDDALANYKKALELDPKLYEAALFCGDVLTQKGDFAQAEPWYQRAIAIDPNRETAYRYSATPLMRQGKPEAARDRYIEAFIVEPASRYARAGLIQWGQATKTNLAHPDIRIPDDVAFDENGRRKTSQVSRALTESQDGSAAWVMYATTRENWQKEKFSRVFPAEKAYRHSLAEEAEAFRAVLNAAAGAKTPNPALARLRKLESDGLLEAYILLALLDNGIAADYMGYLNLNRPKLRRYVLEYVVTGGGK